MLLEAAAQRDQSANLFFALLESCDFQHIFSITFMKPQRDLASPTRFFVLIVDLKTTIV